MPKFTVTITEAADPAAGESATLLPETERLRVTVDHVDLPALTALLMKPAPVPRRRRSDAGKRRAAAAAGNGSRINGE